jgi:hypothetical protein
VVLLVHFFLIVLMYCNCMCSGNPHVEVTLMQGMELYVVILRPGRLLAGHFCPIPVTHFLCLWLPVCVCERERERDRDRGWV